MPYWGCTECHHEWEGREDTCDWCGYLGKILEEKTPLEKMMDGLPELLGILKPERRHSHDRQNVGTGSGLPTPPHR
jgi:hypothetical protein